MNENTADKITQAFDKWAGEYKSVQKSQSEFLKTISKKEIGKKVSDSQRNLTGDIEEAARRAKERGSL